jgi:hypothetical protein
LAAPQPEPEVADLARHPKPGSREWLRRYQQTKDLFAAMCAANPTTNAEVLLLQLALVKEMEKDVTQHG